MSVINLDPVITDPNSSVVGKVEAKPASRYIFYVSLAAVEVASARLFVGTAVAVIILCGVQAGAATRGDGRAGPSNLKARASVSFRGLLGANNIFDKVEGLRIVFRAQLVLRIGIFCSYITKKRESLRHGLVGFHKLGGVLRRIYEGLQGVEL